MELNQFSRDILNLNPELAAMAESKPASKYRNAKAESKGLRFQSGREAAEISKLILAEEQKLIFGLRLQVVFPLQGGLTYRADAVFLDDKLNVHICDVKPEHYRTKEFKRTAKLFRAMYPGKGIEII